MTAPVDTPPVIGDSSLFAVDTSGVIRAFTFSGDLLWERKIPGVPRAPVLTREVLVVGSSSGVLTALRASDGAPLWQREGPPITSPLTFAGEGILFCREGRVELVSFEKGELLGTHPIPGRRCSEPVLYPGTVILSTDEGEVVAIGE
jgi:outer membrane protein assembly factor BamB